MCQPTNADSQNNKVSNRNSNIFLSNEKGQECNISKYRSGTSKYPIYDLLLQCMIVASTIISNSYNYCIQTPAIHNKKSSQQQWYASRPFPHIKMGRLRFGVHGTAGLLSLTVTSCLVVTGSSENFNNPSGWNRVVVTLILISSTVTAVGSLHLIPQVPQTSFITRYISPPHRDAFRRTIGTVIYLNLRLYIAIFDYSNEDGIRKRMWASMLIIYCIYNFLPNPQGLEWQNGNTWIFIIPMSIGLLVDALHQWPTFPCHDTWNQDVVDAKTLLIILWNGLWIAFLFTLAFRKYFVSIQVCYWIATADVLYICFKLGVEAWKVHF